MNRPPLLPFPVLAAVMGLAYLFGAPERTDAGSFTFAKSIAPMPAWGTVFLLGAVVLTGALLLCEPRLMAWALFVGGVIYTWWGCCLAASALTDPRASLNGWAAYGMIAFAHYWAAHRVGVRS